MSAAAAAPDRPPPPRAQQRALDCGRWSPDTPALTMGGGPGGYIILAGEISTTFINKINNGTDKFKIMYSLKR